MLNQLQIWILIAFSFVSQNKTKLAVAVMVSAFAVSLAVPDLPVFAGPGSSDSYCPGC